MAELTLAILLFIAILGITTLISGVWLFYKFMRLLGILIGTLFKGVGEVLSLLGGTPANKRHGPPRVVTADGVFPLVRHAMPTAVRSQGAMVRCEFARCLAMNPADARYCHRCGHLLLPQAQALRPAVAAPA